MNGGSGLALDTDPPRTGRSNRTLRLVDDPRAKGADVASDPKSDSSPVRNGILVASPQMIDPNFSRTVVLLCDYGEGGALGLVVNRKTDIPLAEVLRQMEIPDDGGICGPVLWGGPVQPGSVFLTFSGKSPESDQENPIFSIGEGLHVSPSRQIIQSVAESDNAPGAFITLGYAGWAPGQLDGEIRGGSWIVLEVNPDVIFQLPPEARYDRCIASLGVDESMLWMRPVDE